MHLVELVAPEGIAIVVEPISSAFESAETDFTDDAHGAGGKREKTEQVGQMNPFLKRPEIRLFVGQGTKADGLAACEHDLEADHEICDPAITGHAITDAAFVDHGADHHRRAVGAKVGQHEPMLPQGVMDGIDTGTAFGDHVLHGRIHFENLVHAEHVEEDAALERRANAHTDAAFGDNGDFVFVGEF